jgi:hypothetical protein
LSGRPGVVGLAAGEVVLRRQLFPGHFVKHLGPLLKARVRDSARVAICRRDHNLSAGIRCGSADPVAATRRPSPRRATRFPHGIACGSQWRPSRVRAAGSQAASDPDLGDPVWLRLF